MRLWTALLLIPLGVVAQAEEPPKTPPISVEVSVQERARAELVPDRLFDGNQDGTFVVGNRARLGAELVWKDTVGVFVQVQDVRAWGSEVNAGNGGEGTLFDYTANGFDLHQAYGEVGIGDALDVRIGRQEIDWHGQRLIGSVGWAHQARSFDAVRIQSNQEWFGMDAFYALLLDRPNAIAANADRGEDAHLAAVRVGPRIKKVLIADVVGILRADRFVEETLGTVGFHATGSASLFRYEAEAYGQFGSGADTPIAAWLVGLRAGVKGGDGIGYDVGLGADLVSGNTGDATIGTFDTLYATNHKFYGHFDQYLNLPVHTAGEGLADLLVSAKITSKYVVGGVDLHAFMSMSPTGNGFHGMELDVNAKTMPWKPVTISAGLWLYAPGGFWLEGGSPELAAYLMTDFKLSHKWGG